jgi:uncharacterized protein
MLRRHSLRRTPKLAPGSRLRLVPLVVIVIPLLPLVAFPKGQAALAQTSHTQAYRASERAALIQQQALQKKYNEGTLMILGGYPGTTYFNLAHEMAAALAGRDDLGLIAVDAPGGIESLRDFLLLRGVDLALVPENVLDHADATASLGPRLRERLTYITRLYGEEVHILVGPGADSIENLSGKTIGVPPESGNAEFTVRDLLRRFHINAEVVKVAAADAIDDVRSGTLAALVLVGGKPLRLVDSLPKDGSLRLLALPSTQALVDGHSPSNFRADDYPALISEEQTIDTLSVDAGLIANNTAQSEESNRRIARFVPAFFGALAELAGPRWHPKWGEVNLAATLGKWSRFPRQRNGSTKPCESKRLRSRGNSTRTCELTALRGRRRARPRYEDSCSKNI